MIKWNPGPLRGHVQLVSLWRQRLSVALQREGFRIMRAKMATSLDKEVPWSGDAQGGVRRLILEDVECVPGLFGQGG